MKKTLKLGLYLIMLTGIVSGCHHENRKLLLTNNTDKKLYFSLLADTSDLQVGVQIYGIDPRDSIRPYFVKGGDGAWEYFLNEYSPDSTLSIFLFDDSLITDNALKYKKFTKLNYKIKDLDSLHWKVTIN